MLSGSLIKEARLRSGLTQAELANRTGKTQPVIGRWERCEVQPSLETLRELIHACDLELMFSLATFDDSYTGEIKSRLAAAPKERVDTALKHARQLQSIRRDVLTGRKRMVKDAYTD